MTYAPAPDPSPEGMSMTDSFNPDSIDLGGEPADAVRSLWEQYKLPLILLGGLSFTALVLSAVARRRGVLGTGVQSGWTGPGTLANEVQVSADFAASLRHLASAVDTRLQGMQQQLDALHQAVGTDGPQMHPSSTVPHPNGVASISYEQAVAGQEEAVPPGPASVSLP